MESGPSMLLKGVVAAKAEGVGCMLLLVAGVPESRLLQLLLVAGVADSKLSLLLVVPALPGVDGMGHRPAGKEHQGTGLNTWCI